MLSSFFVALCFACLLNAASVVPSQPFAILGEAVAWDKKFGHYVKNDAGYKYFESVLDNTLFVDFNHFDEEKVCSLFSHLRCATCFAMALNENVPEAVFSAVLEKCHETEIYQVFVATDSYYKDQGSSKKFQALKLHQGAPPAQDTSIHAHQSSIFEHRLSWLTKWEESYECLNLFWKRKLSLPRDEIFPHLMALCNENPYVLLHIESFHFQKHANILIPALLQGDNFLAFSQMVQISYPDGPQKEELHSVLASIGYSSSEALDSVSCASSITSFSYYTQHHAPVIFQMHEQVITDLYTLLEKYFRSPNEKIVSQAFKGRARDYNASYEYSLRERKGALSHFHRVRCRALWGLAEEQELDADFLHLHSTCTHAEKKALSLTVQNEKCAETPGMKILKNVPLPAPTEDLSRLYISHLLI